MKTEQKNNEMIAIFDGWRLSKTDEFGRKNTPFTYCRKNGHKIIFSADLGYDTSWNMLMPVVRKIHDLHQTLDEPHFQYLNFWNLTIFSPIEEVYQGVVNYVEWYNQMIKKSI